MIRALTALLALALALPAVAQNGIGHVRRDDTTRVCIVFGDRPLIHTTQVFPVDENGKLVAGDESNQAEAALAAVWRVLLAAGADDTCMVKLNVVAANQSAVDAARKVIREKIRGAVSPAVSCVVGALPMNDALVAMDAVAVTLKEAPPTADARVLQPGGRVYMSGQAEKAETVAEATAKTLAKLVKTLEFVQATPADVIQARCFLTPMTAAADVTAEFDRVFGTRIPIVFVEWKSELPIEIELIAKCPTAPGRRPPATEYLTPPGMTASPLFARVVRVNRGRTMYFAGLSSPDPGTAEEQITAIFQMIGDELAAERIDMKNLAKAIYYVSDDDASRKLNELRPKYYDPGRPPAASKAMVHGVGMADRSIVIDMIAVVPPR